MGVKHSPLPFAVRLTDMSYSHTRRVKAIKRKKRLEWLAEQEAQEARRAQRKAKAKPENVPVVVTGLERSVRPRLKRLAGGIRAAMR